MATVADAIRRILPGSEAKAKQARPVRFQLPFSPFDLFAACGMLIDLSGAYHHVMPAEAPGRRRALVVTRELHEDVHKAAARWRADHRATAPLSARWERLCESGEQPLFIRLRPDERPPDWWMDALWLMMVADEAAAGLRLVAPLATWIDEVAATAFLEGTAGRTVSLNTLSIADRDIVSVLPKSQPPSVGCTVRSLSRHLSLLPAQGRVRANWLLANAQQATVDAPFNLLLVPFPYKLDASAFVATIPSGNPSWGWFHIAATWAKPATLRRDLEKALKPQIDSAIRDAGAVHGVVFPELALPWRAYAHLRQWLPSIAPGLELFVAGLVDDEDGREGNFVASTAYLPGDGTARPSYGTVVREKHHRWKLDHGQIRRYALGSALDPALHWWERLEILSRSIDVITLRGNATVTTLICEDLARADPCQELVRAIGPSLVMALLMDGPQLRTRWPARYAMVLADDPGSSVLSLTSLALIDRANRHADDPPSRVVALWQEPGAAARELALPEGAAALLLTLRPRRQRRRTLDGRGESDVLPVTWTLGGVVPVSGGDRLQRRRRR